MLIYLRSNTLGQISLKNFFVKMVLQIFAKIEMTRNKNRIFGRHFETGQDLFLLKFILIFFFFFFSIMIFIGRTY